MLKICIPSYYDFSKYLLMFDMHELPGFELLCCYKVMIRNDFVSITFSTIESTVTKNQFFQFDAMKHLQKYSRGHDDNHSLQLFY